MKPSGIFAISIPQKQTEENTRRSDWNAIMSISLIHSFFKIVHHFSTYAIWHKLKPDMEKSKQLLDSMAPGRSFSDFKKFNARPQV